jgi:hypothetical protein
MATLHPTNETSPLLESQNGTQTVQERATDTQEYDEDIDKDITPEPWTQADVIKYGILAVFVLVALISVFIAIRNSPNLEVSANISLGLVLTISQFDYKLALKQALGGGLSGAAGTAKLTCRVSIY